MTFQRSRCSLFLFGDGSIRVDGIKTTNEERIINNPSKPVQPFNTSSQLIE